MIKYLFLFFPLQAQTKGRNLQIATGKWRLSFDIHHFVGKKRIIETSLTPFSWDSRQQLKHKCLHQELWEALLSSSKELPWLWGTAPFCGSDPLSAAAWRAEAVAAGVLVFCFFCNTFPKSKCFSFIWKISWQRLRFDRSPGANYFIFQSAMKGVKLERLDECKYFHHLCLPSTLVSSEVEMGLAPGDGLIVAMSGVWSLSWAMCLCFILLPGASAIKGHMQYMCNCGSAEHQWL